MKGKEKKVKKLTKLGLCLWCGLVVAIMPTVMAEDNDAVATCDTTEVGKPCYDSAKQNFFANGKAITITEKDGNTIISWDGGSQKVDASVNVFGGMHDNDTAVTSNITMNGGQVHNIFGGGLHKSHVTTANVTVTGGKLTGSILGGGASSFETDTDSNPWYSGDPKASPTKVDVAYVTVTGGTGLTPSSSDPSSAIYGGGEGISYTGETHVTVTGGEFALVVAAGVNGYTGPSELKITGGEFTDVQHGMRGTIEDSNIEITGGTITTVWVGMPTATFVEGNTATLSIEENAKVNELKYEASGKDNASVAYVESAVTTVNEDIKSNAVVLVNLTFHCLDEDEVVSIAKGSKLTADGIAELLSIVADGYKVDGYYIDADYTEEFDLTQTFDNDTDIYVKVSKIEDAANPDTSDINVLLLSVIVATGIAGVCYVKKQAIAKN